MDQELRELYQDIILDHSRNPRHFGKLEDANCDAEGYNPLCGDQVHVYLKVDEEGVINDVSFDGKGCAISVASASLMTDMLIGKKAEMAQAIANSFFGMVRGEPAANGADEDEMDRLKVLSGVSEFPMRVKCATLAWHTMRAAITQEEEEVTTE